MDDEMEGSIGEGGRMLNIRLPHGLWVRGRAACLRGQITWSQLIQTALEEHLHGKGIPEAPRGT